MKTIMNRTTFPFPFLGLFSCASNIVSFDDAELKEFQDKNWYLDEIRIGSTIISINRNNKPDSTFTIMFNVERFAGIGAPNHYFGSYTANKDHTILFKKIGSTRMIPIFEMYDIKEHEYFSYIERATLWKMHEGKLELYSSKKDGTKVILVFTQNSL